MRTNNEVTHGEIFFILMLLSEQTILDHPA